MEVGEADQFTQYSELAIAAHTFKEEVLNLATLYVSGSFYARGDVSSKVPNQH